MKQAERLSHINEYYFSQKLKEIEQLNKQGKKIINLGIGSPDLPPSKEVIAELIKVAKKDNVHGYQSYRGIPELRKAMASFYKKYYKVELSSDTEIIPLTGSKEGIMHISMAFVNPGDEVLIPDPGYMTYRSATLLAGGKPRTYTLKASNNFLPNLDYLTSTDLSRVKLMWINYPHMPTGAIVEKDFFKEIIHFAKQHNILVINDNPYGLIMNKQPESLLAADPDMQYSIELNSLSKSHNMAGWRIGMMAGNKEHINSVMKFKSNMDSGMFFAIQKAAEKALYQNNNWFTELNKTYSERKKIAEKIFDKLGVSYSKNQAGLFLWGQLPNKQDSEFFTNHLLKEKGIFIAPGFIFGESSSNYIRISITNNKETLIEALEKI
jgi:aspartate/methionine/tyrosine aminotransferase